MYRRYYKYNDSAMGINQKRNEAAHEIITPKTDPTAKNVKAEKPALFKFDKLKSDDLMIMGVIALLLFQSEEKDIYLILALCYILAA